MANNLVVERALARLGPQPFDNGLCQPASVAQRRRTVLQAAMQAEEQFIAREGPCGARGAFDQPNSAVVRCFQGSEDRAASLTLPAPPNLIAALLSPGVHDGRFAATMYTNHDNILS